ncbi:cobalamin-dependent methionine synthase [Pycnococcus provasolii]
MAEDCRPFAELGLINGIGGCCGTTNEHIKALHDMAANCEDKVRMCQRAYKILVEKVGFDAQDIVFDPNILTVGTGMAEHNEYAVDFINATREIKRVCPGCKISGGVSNIAFSFRGNEPVRRAFHSACLHHVCAAGMDMGIVNAAQVIEDVLLNRRPDSTEHMLEYAATLDPKSKPCAVRRLGGAAPKFEATAKVSLFALPGSFSVRWRRRTSESWIAWKKRWQTWRRERWLCLRRQKKRIWRWRCSAMHLWRRLASGGSAHRCRQFLIHESSRTERGRPPPPRLRRAMRAKVG